MTSGPKITFNGRRADGDTAESLTGRRFLARVQTDPAGVLQAPSHERAVVLVHIGRAVEIGCDRLGHRHRGRSVHGDVDIIPAGTPSRWELPAGDSALILSLTPGLLRGVLEDSGLKGSSIELANRFQIRDVRVEHLGWALKEELESGFPNGRLYVESVAVALSRHLLQHHSTLAGAVKAVKGGLSGYRLKQVLGYIEENLGEGLSLEEIAGLVGLSASHCKAAFRESMGRPLHQYVIERRVDRARSLLLGGERTISAAAQECGFTHASHLTFHMKRMLGASPGRLVRAGRANSVRF